MLRNEIERKNKTSQEKVKINKKSNNQETEYNI